MSVQSIQDICIAIISSSRADCTSHGIPKLSDFMKSSTQPPLVTSPRIATAASVLSLPALDPVSDDELDEKEPVGMALSPIPSASDDTISDTPTTLVTVPSNDTVSGTVNDTGTDTGTDTVNDTVSGTVNDTVNSTVTDTPARGAESRWAKLEEAPSWSSVFVNPPLHRVLFRSIQRGVSHILANAGAGERHMAVTNYSAIPFGEAETEDYNRMMERVSVGVWARREA